MKTCMQTFLFGTLCLILIAPAFADTSWSYQATNTGGPTGDRPTLPLNGTLSGTVVPYHSQPFSVTETTDCTFYSAQQGATFDGVLYLYESTFDPNFPLQGLLDGNDDGALGIGTSELGRRTLTANRDYYLVTGGFRSDDRGIGIFENTVHCRSGTIVHGQCTNISNGTAACLRDDRFEFTVDWRDFSGNTGRGNVSPFGATDSAVVWFFSPVNWEMLIKVIDFCSSPKNSFAVYFSATTTVEFTLRVRDTLTNQTNTYTNALGQTADTVVDDFAFACP